MPVNVKVCARLVNSITTVTLAAISAYVNTAPSIVTQLGEGEGGTLTGAELCSVHFKVASQQSAVANQCTQRCLNACELTEIAGRGRKKDTSTGTPLTYSLPRERRRLK